MVEGSFFGEPIREYLHDNAVLRDHIAPVLIPALGRVCATPVSLPDVEHQTVRSTAVDVRVEVESHRTIILQRSEFHHGRLHPQRHVIR